MICIGCGAEVGEAPAAYAIMHEREFAALEVLPTKFGLDKFHAGAVCNDCFTDPAKRKRPLKAHFSLPQDLPRMVGNAGSTRIG